MSGPSTPPTDGSSSRAGRAHLIETIRDRGVDELEILELFHRIPRDHFLPEAIRHRAWEDVALPIGWGQTASQPSLQARYLRVLRIQPHERVLEIGTGCGFLTALLAQLADRVYSVELISDLARRARVALDALGIRNVALHVGDGTIGWRRFAPYDVIVVSAGAPAAPPTLLEQLAPGGRLLIPVGDRELQTVTLFRKHEDGTIEEQAAVDSCAFVPLLGRYGWPEREGRGAEAEGEEERGRDGGPDRSA